MVNISSNNQYITYEEFKIFANYFIDKSRLLNYNWEWIEKLKNKKKVGFLKLIQVTEIKNNNSDLVENNEEKDEILENLINNKEKQEIEEQYIDNNTLDENFENKKIIWEWHIVYSSIFQIPVLFFNAWNEEHEPIDILSNYDNDIFPIKPLNMPIITQKDHPILEVPYYYIHPCTTGQNMNSLFNINNNADKLKNIDNNNNNNSNIESSDSEKDNEPEKYKNYIAAWLSTTGFIKVDIKYFI